MIKKHIIPVVTALLLGMQISAVSADNHCGLPSAGEAKNSMSGRMMKIRGDTNYIVSCGWLCWKTINGNIVKWLGTGERTSQYDFQWNGASNKVCDADVYWHPSNTHENAAKKIRWKTAI